MGPGKILIIDDEKIALKNLEHIMKKEGYEVTATQSGANALKMLEREEFDLVLTDLRMEKVDGIQILQKTKERYPDSEVVMITGYATIETAIEAMKLGAYYYLAKPYKLEEVRKVVSGALEKVQLRKENISLREQLRKFEGKVQIITENPQMKKVLSYIEIGKKEGARLVTGGRAYAEGDCSRGYFVSPTIFADVAPAMRVAREEIFGPVVSVIRAKDLDGAISIVNGVEYGLVSAIYTRDVNRTARAERDLDAGIVYINASTIGAEIQLPFGGTRKSGYGHKEAGGRGGALDMFTKWKVIYRDFSGRLQKAQIDR